MVPVVTRRQRITFLAIAAVIAVVAVIVLAGGGDETDRSSNSAQTPSPTATATADGAATTATPTPTATPKPPPLLQAGDVKALSFKEGETVRFRVRSDKQEEVHVHGYDIKKDLEPGKTATVSFKATITGIFEIELEGSATQLASLKVVP
jgi:FtsP/CotA-like multicopper oxidase with cupredoxin domain